MALRKYRYSPKADFVARNRPRLVDDDDLFVASPVHDMVQNLWAIDQKPRADGIRLYPGWVRLALPVVSSMVLWAMILWAVGAFHTM